MQRLSDTDQLITLTQAANLVPGRPSTSCLWRWCRRGVLSRAGTRVRLEHVRMGSRIFTTLPWVEEFGRALAEADTKYFDLADTAPESTAKPRRFTQSQVAKQREEAIAQAEQELEEAGI